MIKCYTINACIYIEKRDQKLKKLKKINVTLGSNVLSIAIDFFFLRKLVIDLVYIFYTM